MPVYRNPDFRRLPDGLGAIFAAAARDSFFALPGWYDLMARHGMPAASETRVYSNEKPGMAVALALRVEEGRSFRRLASLTNAYSVEHGVLCGPAADAASGLGAIVGEILDEVRRWDAIALEELDPRAPSYRDAAAALRRAGFLVECVSIPGPGTRKPPG